jgi:hypothetical protein
MRDLFRKGEKVTAATARRITGISTLFGGFSWADPGPGDNETIRRFLVFLEDRRVLYNAMNLEVADQVDRSVHEIREQCTKTLQQLSPNAFGVQPIRGIREAGRRFHDDRNERFRFFDDDFRDGWRRENPGFFVALGAYRATVGHQVALLSAHYDIDIEGDLASILPAIDVPASNSPPPSPVIMGNRPGPRRPKSKS